MRGNITRRGKRSWRIKFDVSADERGNRQIRYVTVRGKRCDAKAELARLLNDHNQGTLVNPTKVTVGEYLRSWLGNKTDITAVTHERYQRLSNAESPRRSVISSFRSSSQSMCTIGSPISARRAAGEMGKVSPLAPSVTATGCYGVPSSRRSN